MSCCGQKRQQWQQQITQPQPAPEAPAYALEDPVPLRYHGSHSYMIKGPRTGLLYLFAANGKSLMVDNRDVTPLLADNNFSLA